MVLRGTSQAQKGGGGGGGGGGEAPTEIALARRTLALLACFLPPCHPLHIVQELECFGILILYLRF